MRKLYFSFLIGIIFSFTTNAQVTGTKNIPGDYSSLAAAITDLNTNGVGAGGALINIAGGYTETAPGGGFVLGSTTLNATLSAANQLTIKKASGVNPVLTAPIGTSTTVDGIFKITGCDYVTIDGISLTDPNTGSPASMEWGYALLNLNGSAPFDGCQFVTIKNCAISLNRNNPNGAYGIYSSHNTALSSTGLTITATSDAHSNNKFYSNTISNIDFGIYLNGYQDPTSPYILFDQNNDVGGNSAATGNTITNCGGNSAFNNFCIVAVANNNDNVSYNTVDNASGGVNNSTTLYGIYVWGPNSTYTVNNNNVTVKEASTSTANVLAGIYSNSLGTNITCQNNTVNVFSITGSAVTTYGIYFPNSNNITVTNNNVSVTQSLSGTTYGINSAATGTINISNNTVQASTTTALTSTFGLIYASALATSETISNNIINNVSLNTTGTTYIIYASNNTTNVTISGNQANNFTRTAASGTTYCIYNLGSPASGTSTITNNSLTNFTIAGSANTYGIYYNTATGHAHTISGNTVSNWTTPGAGTNYGIYCPSGSTNSIFNNTVSNISNTATGTCYGIYAYAGNTGTGSVYGNTITGLTNAGPTFYGLYVTMGVPTAANIYKNKISNITSNGATGVAYGLYLSTATTANIYNNLIGNIYTPATTNANGVAGLYINGGTTVNAYYNTIYLSGTSSGTGFGTSGIYASTTPTVTLRNNLVSNNSIPTGTSRAAAYRRSSTTLTSYGASSNNNMWSSGGNVNNVIFFDGTTANATLASFQALVTPRDANSVTEVSTPFLSTVGTNTNFLHISTTTPTVVESGGANIATYTDDYDGDARNASTPDIGADEFSGLAATACSGTPTAGTISGANNICANQFTILTLSGFSSATGISIQWQSSAVSGGPYADVAGATGTNFSTGALAAGVYYYVAKVTCANGGASATTAEYVVTVNANPTITVSPSTSICLGGSGVSLTASGGNTYTWSPATGLSATTGATVTANPTTTTTYTVTGTIPAGCSSTATVTITVNAPPTVTASATQTAVCMNGTTQLLAVGATPGNVTTYSFTAGTGATLDPMTGASTAIGTGDDDTPVASPAAIGFTFYYEGVNYTQFSASPDGWILLGGTTAVSQFTNAMTSATNAPKISAYWDDLATGTTGWVKTLVTGTAPNRILKIEWYVTIPRNTGGAANSTFQMWLYETTGKIEFRYGTMGSGVMSASVGLTGATSTNINSVTISSNTNSTVTANDANAGQPPSGTIYTFSPPQPSYSWSPATFLSATNIANPIASNMTATTTYTVTATAANGCTATANVTILVGTALSATASATQTTICSGTSITVSATPVGGGGPYTYSWSDGVSVVSTAQSFSASPGTTTTYTVTITDACSNTTTASVTVTVNPQPNVTVTPSSATICSGASASFVASGNSNTYAWSPATGLNATTGAFVTANPTSTTTYTVTGTITATGCTRAVSAIVTVNASPAVPTVTATPASVCVNGISQLQASLPAVPVSNLYTLSGLTGQTYTTLSGGGITIINTNAQLTPGFSSGNQDDGGVLITIPFTFTYMGSTFTQMSMSTNGWVAAGNLSTITAGPDRTPGNLFTTALPNNTIAAWFKDMGANFPTGTGSMRHGLIGTDIYAFQWDKAVGSGFSDGSAILISFQVNIYGPASTNPGRIEMIYGPTVGAITFGASIGIEDATGGTGHYINALDGTTTSTITSTVWPGNGNGYRFDPAGASYTWTPTAGLFTNAAGTIPYAGGSASTLYAKQNTSATYTVNNTAGGCITSITVNYLVDQVPTPVITASPSGPICNGSIQQLTVASSNTAAVKTTSSTTVVPIPDNLATGATNTIAVSGIPAGAVVFGVDVRFRISHTSDGDLIINVRAPNNNILNLVNQRGGSGDNFSNTIISSGSGLPAISSGSAPFAGSYSPDGATISAAGLTSNVINFTGLFSVPNGNWTLALQDNANVEVGALNSWSVIIYYYIPDNTVWSPTTSLYTNPGASTAYTGTNLATVYAKPASTITYNVTATTPGGCSGTSGVTVNVNQPPAITGQPVTLSLCQGNTATFNVTATGAGLTYQWYLNGNPLSNGGNISGATGTTLTVTNVTLADAGNYTVVVSGTCTPSPVTSSIAALTVGTPPIVSTQPQSQTACAGNTVSFSVASAGTNTYQWFKNGVALVTDGVHIFGATTSTLTIVNITAADAGNYTAVVTNSCSFSTTSAVAVLTFSTNDRWLGIANSDWNNPNNWCNGVPTLTTDVEIPSGTPFPAILAVNGDVRNLQINAGATLTVTASGWLSIWGSTLTQNGTFAATLGTLSFRNTANLNVPAITAANVVMNGTGGITLTGNMRVDSALTLTSGNITLGTNNLTMKGGTIGSTTSHIVTNGTGAVTNNNVGVATVVFPVAPTATSYNPVQIATGGGLNYTVRVATGIAPAITNSAIAINRTWTITASASPTSPVQLTFGYADVDGNAGYNAANRMETGYYSGTAWTITTGNGGTAAMGTATARLVYTTSQNFGTGAWVVANVGALTGIVTGTPNLNTDIYSAKLLPNLVNNQAILRVMSRRAMNIQWTVTDIQGRVVMKFNKPILAGQNDINLKLGHLASGSYQVVGYTDKGITNVISFVRL